MVSQKVVSASLVVGASVTMFLVLDATLGRSMDMLRTSFTGLAANMTVGATPMMSAEWGGVVTAQLATWDIFFDSFVIFIIAICIWAFKVAFIDSRYDRAGGLQ